jgi:hypothetical protein
MARSTPLASSPNQKGSSFKLGLGKLAPKSCCLWQHISAPRNFCKKVSSDIPIHIFSSFFTKGVPRHSLQADEIFESREGEDFMMRSPDLRMRTYADFKKSSVLDGPGRDDPSKTESL